MNILETQAQLEGYIKIRTDLENYQNDIEYWKTLQNDPELEEKAKQQLSDFFQKIIIDPDFIVKNISVSETNKIILNAKEYEEKVAEKILESFKDESISEADNNLLLT